MKRITVILIVVLGCLNGYAQQLGQTSQFLLNKSLYSPALVGIDNQFEGVLNYRNQWTSMNNSPKTLVLSVNNPFEGKSYAIGGSILTESLGATKRNFFSLSYVYDVKVADDYLLAFGLSASMTQYRTDGSKLVLTDAGDETIDQKVNMVSLSPDFNFGMAVKHEDFYVGLSVNNLIESRINMLAANGKREQLPLELARHFYVYGSYTVDLDKFDAIPFVVVKGASNSPYQFELGSKFVHKESKVWGGISYRHLDAISFLLGYTIMEQIDLGYSYDLTVSKIRMQTLGSHELSLRFFLDKGESSKGKARFE
jgi:type IX secretion system PorP/SprF family membrane protein